MKEFLARLIRRHGSLMLNVFLVVALGRYAAVKAWEAWQAGTFDFVEAAFAVNNVVMLTLILIRRKHVAIDRGAFRQAVAIVAFFSGIAFFKHPTPCPPALPAGFMIAAMVLGALSLLNLGRSFGILIAVRQVKTQGLYRLVRHPMYLSEILWRIGYVAGNLYWPNVVIFLASSGCYVYRAILEERFLARTPEYREYMRTVRYRFIPGVF